MAVARRIGSSLYRPFHQILADKKKKEKNNIAVPSMLSVHLRSNSFTHLKVLYIVRNFCSYWNVKGFHQNTSREVHKHNDFFSFFLRDNLNSINVSKKRIQSCICYIVRRISVGLNHPRPQVLLAGSDAHVAGMTLWFNALISWLSISSLLF